MIATGVSVKLPLQMGILPHPPPMTLVARTYFEDIQGLADQTVFHFDGVPLPGYGWVFPLSPTAANVGAGFSPRAWFRNRGPATAAKALESFLCLPSMQAMLGSVRQIGPVKGYPLRTDFATAPTFAKRVVLVGEAAGLVNPLTGEGIDYALESGRIAAEHLALTFAEGEFSGQNLERYDYLLRQRFQRLFCFCEAVRTLFLNRLCLNWLIRWAARRPDLKVKLIELVLGSGDSLNSVSPKSVLKILRPPPEQKIT